MAHSSWGSGWPNCQRSKIDSSFSVETRWGTVKFPGGVRRELRELITRLVKETANRGYRFGIRGNPSYGCWGFNCRQIRGSSKPSNHSWGTAIDINAHVNPMGSRLITDMPSWMPDLWNAYGFRWGGDYISRPDAMHYEFMGSVNDAARYTAIARQNRLGENRSIPAPPLPSPPAPKPEPEKPVTRKDDDVYFLIQGDKTAEWWLTNCVEKRHVRTHEQAQRDVVRIRAAGGICVTRNTKDTSVAPEIWPQADVDAIPRSDINPTHDVMRVYAAQKDSPLHEIVRQVLGKA